MQNNLYHPKRGDVLIIKTHAPIPEAELAKIQSNMPPGVSVINLPINAEVVTNPEGRRDRIFVGGLFTLGLGLALAVGAGWGLAAVGAVLVSLTVIGALRDNPQPAGETNA